MPLILKKQKKALKGFDFEIKMTSKDHNSGTDRVAEVVESIKEAKIIINIQGDEPMIDPKIIDALVEKIETPFVEFATVISKNLLAADILNPNVVKAFINEKKKLLSLNETSLIPRLAVLIVMLVYMDIKRHPYEVY